MGRPKQQTHDRDKAQTTQKKMEVAVLESGETRAGRTKVGWQKWTGQRGWGKRRTAIDFFGGQSERMHDRMHDRQVSPNDS